VEALSRVERIGPNPRLVFTTTQPDGSGGVKKRGRREAGGVVGDRGIDGCHAGERQL
jgi:hypothetical protein